VKYGAFKCQIRSKWIFIYLFNNISIICD